MNDEKGYHVSLTSTTTTFKLLHIIYRLCYLRNMTL